MTIKGCYAASNGSVQIRISQEVAGFIYYGSAATFTLCNQPSQASNFSSSSVTSTTATISLLEEVEVKDL